MQKILIGIAVVALIGFVASVQYACHCKTVAETAQRDADIYLEQLETSREIHANIISTLKTLEAKEKEIRYEVRTVVEANPEWSVCPLPDDVQRLCNDILDRPVAP